MRKKKINATYIRADFFIIIIIIKLELFRKWVAWCFLSLSLLFCLPSLRSSRVLASANMKRTRQKCKKKILIILALLYFLAFRVFTAHTKRNIYASRSRLAFIVIICFWAIKAHKTNMNVYALMLKKTEHEILIIKFFFCSSSLQSHSLILWFSALFFKQMLH